MDRVAHDAEPYIYPAKPHRRRHGPAGYSSYKSYRPWLEDDFIFRCIYCLKRMVWAPTDTWVVDHLVPQNEAPDLICEYDNLVLSCGLCNHLKSSHRVPDPSVVAYGSCLRVETDGTVKPLNRQGRRLIETIRLNHSRYVDERRKIILVLTIVASVDKPEFERLMGFPAHLPDLAKLKPPENSRPGGVSDSYFAKRTRGELPSTY